MSLKFHIINSIFLQSAKYYKKEENVYLHKRKCTTDSRRSYKIYTLATRKFSLDWFIAVYIMGGPDDAV